MKENLKPFTKEQYDRMKAKAESMGYTFKTKWRKGLKTISLGDIILSESK